MTEEDFTKQRIWHRYIAADGAWRRKNGTAAEKRPPGEDLAVLRRGLGRPAGTVLEMFPFYTCPVDDFAARRGEVSAEQEAEHMALALYGLHQQSQDRPMHRDGVGLGRAMLVLRRHDRTSDEAVDSRFQQAFSATSTAALQLRVRGLVTQLKDIKQPLDYNRLVSDIHDWNRPESRSRVRRRWGLDYYGWTQKSTAPRSGR
ncbi:type I-E CRISPR-associated protein Cse2/CasB [Streptomyces sp. NBC_01387]|uniref:type I-E CRISPR-associated protein Cse2/CasB n=1 Tax=unclassified Streptomyces TaxID=2593676 RepID=UPI002259FDD0|nr:MULTISPECIES: type I-E CRISPR-associated protein Cse2/CasB [unclassified Streptomyces]MCX4551284.1 type I-E CRISPR-associated protein Cse2/CasB [Streptomyces sp. NBC_01500]